MLLFTLIALSLFALCWILIYLFFLIAFVTFPKFQSYFVFAHFLNFPNGKDLDKPEAFGLPTFSTRHITIKTPDVINLGGWHILSRHTVKIILSTLRSRVASGDSLNTLFDESMKKADLVILYFHGQVGNRGKENRVSTYKALRVALPTADIVTIDYRGFGDSEGFPTEDGVLIDARAAWNWITERVPEAKVMIYGHSLGSGIATKLARQLSSEGIKPLALVLEAPFTSLPDMMTAYRKIPFLKPFQQFPEIMKFFRNSLAHRFESIEHIKNVNDTPLLILHAHKDFDIPVSYSQTLFRQFISAHQSEKKISEPTFSTFEREGTLHMQSDIKAWYLQALHAQHNNVHSWEFVGERLREFIEQVCGLEIRENNSGWVIGKAES